VRPSFIPVTILAVLVWRYLWLPESVLIRLMWWIEENALQIERGGRWHTCRD
jgi:hypothetical protein